MSSRPRLFASALAAALLVYLAIGLGLKLAWDRAQAGQLPVLSREVRQP